MENSKGADRRRNVFDIVADLGFLDRKPMPAPAEAQPPPAPILGAPPALTLVKPQSPPPRVETAVTVPPRTEVEPADTLTEAQVRAAQQRMAAERLLQEAIELEERLADEAAQACGKNVERIAAQRAQAEALQAGDRTRRSAAVADVAAAEALLAEARGRLEVAEGACSESDVRFNDASAAEAAARAEAAAASELSAARRAAREELEERLHGIQQRAVAAPADAATRIAERRAADAAKRIAERRAADAQRGAAS